MGDVEGWEVGTFYGHPVFKVGLDWTQTREDSKHFSSDSRRSFANGFMGRVLHPHQQERDKQGPQHCEVVKDGLDGWTCRVLGVSLAS